MREARHIKAALKFIEANLHRRLTVALVCEHVGLSISHFHRMFTEVVGAPIAQYALQRKISEAAKRLLQTDDKVIDIAFDYGFESPETFARAFRRLAGITPSEYRKKRLSLFERKPFASCVMNCVMNYERRNVMPYNMVHLLSMAVDLEASDLTIAPGSPPYCCVGGTLRFLGEETVTNEEAERLMLSVLSVTSKENEQVLCETGAANYGFYFEDVAGFRVSIIKKEGCGGPVMRLRVTQRNV